MSRHLVTVTGPGAYRATFVYMTAMAIVGLEMFRRLGAERINFDATVAELGRLESGRKSNDRQTGVKQHVCPLCMSERDLIPIQRSSQDA